MKIALVAQHATPLSEAGESAPDAAARPDASAAHAEDDVRLRNLSRGLAAGGHDVTVYAQRPDQGAPARTELCPGVRVEYIGPVAGRDDADLLARVPGFAGPLHDRLGEDPPDVVHALRWTSGLAALAATRDLHIPVVQSFSPMCVTERRHHLIPPGTGTERIRLEPAIGRSASAVLAGCSDEESELARAGVPRRSINVVPCGVDTHTFTPEGPAANRNGRPRLVTVAGLDSHEELATLLRALSAVPDAELVIAGGPARDMLAEDPAYRKLSELAGSLKVTDRVEFTGQVSRAELPSLLRSADLLVSVSEYDPDGMVVLEAMACGTPVVATTAGGQEDAIVDGTTGILVPPHRPAMLAHRIRQLLTHPMQLAAFGVAAADRARSRYSWDRIARETLAVYDRATGSAA
jgi:glycosyltransferase involved in cell wall biosynthesis